MINIIAALTKDRVIGKEGDLPWKISGDLKIFKHITSGNTVVMGRKTYDSIGKPLPNRNNIVISRSMPTVEDVDVCNSIESALEKAESYGKEVFVIGGASIYNLTLPKANKMYLSWIKEDYPGNTYFPEFDESEWTIESRKDYEEFELIAYTRKNGKD